MMCYIVVPLLLVLFWGFIRLLMTQPINMPDADDFIEQCKRIRGEK